MYSGVKRGTSDFLLDFIAANDLNIWSKVIAVIKIKSPGIFQGKSEQLLFKVNEDNV